jgi:hypothetical protein
MKFPLNFAPPMESGIPDRGGQPGPGIVLTTRFSVFCVAPNTPQDKPRGASLSHMFIVSFLDSRTER